MTQTTPTPAPVSSPVLTRAQLLERLAASNHQAAVLMGQMVERSVLHASVVMETYDRLLTLIEDHALVTLPVGSGLAAVFMDRQKGWIFTLHVASSGVELNRHPASALPHGLQALMPFPVGRGYLEYVPMPVRSALVAVTSGGRPDADFAFGGSQIRLDATPVSVHEALEPLRDWLVTHAWARRCERSDAPWSRERGNDRLRFSSGDALVGLEVRDYFLDVTHRPAFSLLKSWRHQGLHVHWHHFASRVGSQPHFTDF